MNPDPLPSPNQDQSLSSSERFEEWFKLTVNANRGTANEAWIVQDAFYQPIITKLQEGYQKLHSDYVALVTASVSVVPPKEWTHRISEQDQIKILKEQIQHLKNEVERLNKLIRIMEHSTPTQMLINEAKDKSIEQLKKEVEELVISKAGLLLQLGTQDAKIEELKEKNRILYSTSSPRTTTISSDYYHELISDLEKERKLREAAERVIVDFEYLTLKAIDILQRHIPPDGTTDHEAMSEFYGIFDGPHQRGATKALEAYRATSTVPHSEGVSNTPSASSPTPTQEKE